MITKTKSSASLLAWLFAALMIAFLIALAVPSVHAADAAAGATTTVATTAWYANPVYISTFITVVTSVFAVWSHTEKTTAQKITESLVVGIEQATKLPAVAAAEAQMKAKIKQVATDYGVQPLLDKVVQDLT